MECGLSLHEPSFRPCAQRHGIKDTFLSPDRGYPWSLRARKTKRVRLVSESGQCQSRASWFMFCESRRGWCVSIRRERGPEKIELRAPVKVKLAEMRAKQETWKPRDSKRYARDVGNRRWLFEASGWTVRGVCLVRGAREVYEWSGPSGDR